LKKEQLHNQNKIYDEDDDGENEYGDEDGEGEDGKKKEVKKCFNVIIPDWYLKLSEKMKGIVDSDDPENMTGKKFEKFIVIMILLNTFFMSIEHYNEPLWVTNTGVIANYIFTFLFAIEMIMKLSGFGFKRYFSEGFNIFDSFIVIMSFVELLSADSNSSLSVLRAFRLLRIFKIIRSWESLKKLLKTVLDSITAITNLAILIFLYLFISALLTKQFYPDELLDGDGNPSRYSFQSTGDSLVSVFIILTGENWNEIMVQVIAKYESFSSAPVFILIVILGNWMLLNLFLAILLKALSTDDSSDKEESKVEKDAKADTTNNQEEDEEYSNNQLDSSNSNIEQEFNKIKEELERITKGIFLD
jgi:voltage-dependent calcium channel L type alpha-1D